MRTKLEEFSQLRENEFWDVEQMSEEEIAQAFKVLDEKMNIIYRFVLSYNEYINMRHKYSAEVEQTMMESHILTDICDSENSTVTGLAESWGRSVSATSQTVRKLLKDDLVVRENSRENGKIYYLNSTDKGERVSNCHKKYDTLDTIKTIKSLMHTLTFDEIETMFKGLEAYVELLKPTIK